MGILLPLMVFAAVGVSDCVVVLFPSHVVRMVSVLLFLLLLFPVRRTVIGDLDLSRYDLGLYPLGPIRRHLIGLTHMIMILVLFLDPWTLPEGGCIEHNNFWGDQWLQQ